MTKQIMAISRYDDVIFVYYFLLLWRPRVCQVYGSWHPTKFTTKFQEKSHHHSIIMTSEDSSDYKHDDTLIKVKMKKVVELCERINILYYKKNVFKTFEV